MTAVDTNVLVRFLTSDNPQQAALAKALFGTDQIWIAKTVLLETGWVLRSLYGFDQDAICGAFTKLLGLTNVQVEDEPSIVSALALAGEGIELADAMHLTSRPPNASFVSFDRAFILRAKRARVTGISGLTR